MKVLITGAAGFIGFHLFKLLSEEGFEVIGVDNINSYYDVNLKLSRLKVLGFNFGQFQTGEITRSTVFSNSLFIKEDIENRSFITSLFNEHRFECVVNLAAQAGVRYSLENPHKYIDSNVTGFLNILEACRVNPVRHLVYASSSSVYGTNTKMPFRINDPVDHPVSLYAATKRMNELMAHTYSHLFNIPSTGLRFFTVYGPWGRPDMAPMLFANAIKNGKKIKVFNNGEMERDFTYIDDIIAGIKKVLNNPPICNSNWNSEMPALATSHAPFKLYNIGNSSPIKLMTFIDELESCMQQVAEKEFLPMQPGDVCRTWADIEDLTRDVGYYPLTSVPDGVRKFIEWYQHYYA